MEMGSNLNLDGQVETSKRELYEQNSKHYHGGKKEHRGDEVDIILLMTL